jgi:type I restriction enzyme M protein
VANNTSNIVAKVWNYCNILRDDGVSYGDYLEQLTFLLFLKMADEYSKPPYNRKINIPSEFSWESLISKNGAKLELHYINLLKNLGIEKGMLGTIFNKLQNRIQYPAKLFKLVQLINEETWISIDYDVKGEI